MSDAPLRPEGAGSASAPHGEPGTVAGVYRASRPWAVRVWAAVAVCWAAAAVLNFRDGHVAWGAFQAVLAVGFLALLGLHRAQCTVVTPTEVRVRTDIRARTLTWDQIRAIHDPGRWAWSDTLTLAVTTGEQVVTHIPRDRYAALKAYATAHGARTTSEPGQPGEEGP